MDDLSQHTRERWNELAAAGVQYSRPWLDLLLGMRADNVCSFTFLKGNHEDMFLDFLGYGGLYGQAFLMNGGQQTIASYNCDPLTPGDEIALALPEVHREFFLSAFAPSSFAVESTL